MIGQICTFTQDKIKYHEPSELQIYHLLSFPQVVLSGLSQQQAKFLNLYRYQM